MGVEKLYRRSCRPQRDGVCWARNFINTSVEPTVRLAFIPKDKEPRSCGDPALPKLGLGIKNPHSWLPFVILCCTWSRGISCRSQQVYGNRLVSPPNCVPHCITYIYLPPPIPFNQTKCCNSTHRKVGYT